mmetsp:Transcript_22117/g.30778  ORF Transcript_22117/g.30778 Transcript_22117/m.30778 type:complete len:105 (+) Transcript_22117:85-399(+)
MLSREDCNIIDSGCTSFPAKEVQDHVGSFQDIADVFHCPRTSNLIKNVIARQPFCFGTAPPRKSLKCKITRTGAIIIAQSVAAPPDIQVGRPDVLSILTAIYAM